MPVTPTYPGVYVEEIPSGVRTISGVATSVAAFPGRTIRGTVNEPVRINSFADFEREFGGLWSESSLGFAVRDFFLNGGGQAIVVRLFSPFFSSDSDRSAALASATAAAQAAQQAASAQNATPASVATATRTAADNEPAGVGRTAAGKVATAAETEAARQGATAQSVSQAAQDAVGAAAPLTKARLATGGLNLEAADEGNWANALRVRVDHKVRPGTTDLFNLTVRDGNTEQVEELRNLSVAQGAERRVDLVLANESKLVRARGSLPSSRPGAHGEPQPNKTVWEEQGGNNPATSVGVSQNDRASDGAALVENDFTGSGLQGAKRGLFALEKADIFNILCIPPYKSGGDVDENLWASAAAYCRKRRAILIVDAPVAWNDKSKAVSGAGGLVGKLGANSKNAALFFPRIYQPNPLRENVAEPFAPSGAVAGVIARTDTERGVWKAPAGLDASLVGVQRLSVPLTDDENGELNPLAVNCLRAKPGVGHVVWGARTANGADVNASEWKYLPVRRVALYIEESLYRGTQWVVFEPNDEPLWAQIRLNVGAFLHTLFRQGAFAGTTPRDAYFVNCDKNTTTPDDVNRGIVNIVVGFAPLKPAEFVILKLQQMARQPSA